jgi:hypothetical protein
VSNGALISSAWAAVAAAKIIERTMMRGDIFMVEGMAPWIAYRGEACAWLQTKPRKGDDRFFRRLSA